jgi:hypothetical protein
MVRLMLNGVYADLKTTDPSSGLSIWLQACIVARLSIIETMTRAGCDIHETYTPSPDQANKQGYVSGWNCLFFVVLHASWPRSSAELEVLRFLIRAGVDPHQQDAAGNTISDYVDDDVDSKLGTYRRELWYSALEREHVHVDRSAGQWPWTPVYTWKYRPLHYRALCHLETWERDSVGTQVARVREDFPWSREEAEAMSRIALLGSSQY